MFRKLNHKLNALIRKVKLVLTDTIVGRFSRFIYSGPYGANLVLRLDGKIGDAVTSTGFLKQIKLKNENEKLILITSGSQGDVFKNLEYVDELIQVDKSFSSLIKTWFKIRKIKFKYIVNTSHILKPNVLMIAGSLKAHTKITFSNKGIKTFSQHVDIDFVKDHITDRYQKTLKLMGIDAGHITYDLKLNEKYVLEAKKVLNKDQSKKIIALNSFAGARDRSLNQEKTIAIVKKLVENPHIFVLSLAGRSDGEKIKKWMSEYSHPRWQYFSNFEKLDQNCALLSQCNLLITPDTAWVHIASALKIKLVAIFREDTDLKETNSVIWAPHETIHKIVIAPRLETTGSNINNVNIDQVISEVHQLNL